MGESKRDIARQFDLPERQSKLGALFKETEYCICRSSDATRFMIGCDNCDEWFHGDCIGLTEKDAKNIKSYFCQQCQSKNHGLEIVYKKSKNVLHSSNKDKERKIKERDNEKAKLKEKRREAKEKEKEDKHDRKSNAGRPKKSEVRKSESSRKKEILSDADDDWKPPASPEPVIKAPRKRPRKQRLPSFSESEDELIITGDQVNQCYGPKCVNAALPNSKYCSEDCGIRLASARICRVLPSRVAEWVQSPSIAQQKNEVALEEIRKKQANCRKEIHNLETKRRKLDDHISTVQRFRLDPDDDDADFEEEEGTISCFTCGHEVAIKTCIKHMEKCYNKVESRTSFASAAKTQVEGIPIFCDFYNPLNKTYCKRLKVLCPEHTKEPKIQDDEVCGCPLIRNVCQVTDDICKIAKKKCNKHFAWEKIQRAEIDMERVRQWLKLDEMLESERIMRQALTNRAGVLGLLLHSSYDHDKNSSNANAPPHHEAKSSN